MCKYNLSIYLFIYLHIYIYICVCVCFVFFFLSFFLFSFFLSLFLSLSPSFLPLFISFFISVFLSFFSLLFSFFLINLSIYLPIYQSNLSNLILSYLIISNLCNLSNLSNRSHLSNLSNLTHLSNLSLSLSLSISLSLSLPIASSMVWLLFLDICGDRWPNRTIEGRACKWVRLDPHQTPHGSVMLALCMSVRHSKILRQQWQNLTTIIQLMNLMHSETQIMFLSKRWVSSSKLQKFDTHNF